MPGFFQGEGNKFWGLVVFFFFLEGSVRNKPGGGKIGNGLESIVSV